MFAILFVFVLAFLGFAQAQDLPIGACNINFEVECTDCSVGESFKAEIYQYSPSGQRMQVKYLPAMKSGESISSGDMIPGRRTLVIEDADFDTVGCVNDENIRHSVKVILHQGDTEGSDSGSRTELPVPEASPEPMITATVPPTTPEVAPPARVVAEEEEAGFDEEEEESPSRIPVAAVVPPPLPMPAVLPPDLSPEPAPEEEGDGERMASSTPHVVGWAAPGGDPVWTGNAGDYPSAPATNRRGKFTESGETRCPAGKLAAVLGTADHISGGRQAQDALDDTRASDLAPADSNGAYAIALRTAIVGDQAAAVWCINPGDLNPTSFEGRAMLAAAELPPPAPPGVTPEDLQRALDAQAQRLREELAPPEEGPPPETVASTPTPFVLRKGGFIAFQYSTTFGKSVAYPHAMAGGFVTFNLTKSERVGLEPYLAFGTDFVSDHCGDAEWGEAECSGWYLSANVGTRLPIAVVKKDTWRLMVFPDLGLVADDITTGFTAWGELVSLQVGAEVWLTGKVPLAFSLQVGGTRLAWMNASFQHRNGWAMPIRGELKVPFK